MKKLFEAINITHRESRGNSWKKKKTLNKSINFKLFLKHVPSNGSYKK